MFSPVFALGEGVSTDSSIPTENSTSETSETPAAPTDSNVASSDIPDTPAQESNAATDSTLNHETALEDSSKLETEHAKLNTLSSSTDGVDVTAALSYLDGNVIRANQPMVIAVKVKKPAGSDVSGSSVTLSGFNASYIDLTKTKLSNGSSADAYGNLTYDSSLGTITYKFDKNLNVESEASFTINIYIYGQDLNADSPMQTVVGTYLDSLGTEAALEIANGNYFVSKKATSNSSESRIQAPGGGLYSTADGKLLNNSAGAGSTTSGGTTINGRAYYRSMQYMATNNVLDPGNIGIHDTGRTYTFKVSGSAKIDTSKIYLSKNGSYFTLDSAQFANFGTYTLSADQQTLTTNFIDGVNISWLVFNMNTYTPNVNEVYTFTWKYTATKINSTVTETIANHSSQNFFVQDGTVGFTPVITANDKTVKTSTAIADVNAWLLEGVTATDVEDGTLTSSVKVKNDGGFEAAWAAKTPGAYQVTYSVTDKDNNTATKTVTATIYSDIIVHYRDGSGNKLKDDVTLSGNAGDTYTIDTNDFAANNKNYYFVSATPNNLTGKYGANGQPTEVILTYIENKQSLTGSNYTMYVGDEPPTVADFNAVATDKNGNALEVAADLSAIDFSKAGTYDVVLTTTDGQTKTVQLLIKANQQTLTGSDYTMYVGDQEATVADFNATATDKAGQPLEVAADLSAIDFSKVGTYDVVLTTTDGQTKTVQLLIKANQQTLTGSDYTMYVGDQEATVADFNATATDKAGQPLEVAADLSAIDFSKAGTYDVVLTTTDGQTKTVQLLIKANQQTLTGSDYTMYVGDQEATVADFNATATDKAGQPIEVTADLSAIDFSKAGTHAIELKAADGQTKTVQLIIKADQQQFTASDYTMYLGDQQPTAADFKPVALDKDGHALDVTADFSKVDFTKVGTYEVVLTATEQQAKTFAVDATDPQTLTVKLTIKDKEKPNSSEPQDTSGGMTAQLPGTSDSIPTSSSGTGKPSLPNTGEHVSTTLYVLGTLLLATVGIFFARTKRTKKEN